MQKALTGSDQRLFCMERKMPLLLQRHVNIYY